MNDDMKITPLLQPNKLWVTENRDHTLYEYYLLGEIGNPEDYIDLCNALRQARPEDNFIIRLNSGGGQVRTGNQIINALQECEATTIGFIEHDCGSMCTFIFLACKTWGVSKYAEWFSHTYSSGNFGKECETFEASQFMRKQTHKRIREEYKGFLSDEEIESILTGTDIYLDADEIMKRLETYVEVQDKEYEENRENSEQQEDFSIDKLLEETATMAAEKVMKKVTAKFDIVPKAPKERKTSQQKRVDKKLSEDLNEEIQKKID